MVTKESGKNVLAKSSAIDNDISVNERKVLYAVVKWSTANDRVLSKKIGLKMSTVTAIRNRLKRAGWFKTVRIPLLGRLGCEMMVVDCFRISPTIKPEDAVKGFKEILGPVGSCIYAFADRFHLITIRLHTTYSDAFNAGNILVDSFIEKGLINQRPAKGAENVFPYAHSRNLNFFRFAGKTGGRRHNMFLNPSLFLYSVRRFQTTSFY